MLLSVSHGGVVHDVAVDCPPEVKVGLFVDALCSALGLQVARPTLRLLSRSPRAVGRDERLLTADIHDGDVVAIVPETVTGPAPKAVATLTALSGPSQGRVYPVGPGRSRIGRDRGADIVVLDPAVSQFHAVLVVSDTIELSDAGSTNGVSLGGRILAGSARLQPGQSFTVGDTELLVGRVDDNAAGLTVSVPFNPTPRVFAPFAGKALECPAPPAEPNRQGIPWLSALLPLVAGAGIAALSRSVYLLAFMLLSPLLIFSSTYESRRQQARDHAQALADLEENVEDVLARQAALQADEMRLRHEGSPAVDAVAAWAIARDHRLWERGADHVDVLSLRVGTAVLPTAATVRLASGGRPKDRRPIEARLARTGEVSGLPVEVPLHEVGHVGVSGGESAAGVARSLVVQAAGLHSPAELSVAAIVDQASVADWDWLKWLPHTRSAHAPIPGELVCTRPDAAARLVERLTDLVRDRLMGSYGAPTIHVNRVLLLVNGASSIDPSRLANLYDTGPDAGVHVVFVGGSPNAIPRHCGAVVVAAATADTSSVAFTASGSVVRGVSVEALSARTASAVSRALAPLVDSSAPPRDGATLPGRVNLVDLLGGPAVMNESSVVVERWSESRGLTAVIGAVAGSLLRLDVRTDGPHALVAGTTGAGKSELLQSFIAALALSHSPKRVNFLLVDYKGGAAFKECKDLPHTVGLVTDLNPQEVRRALVSLDAEIKRREHLLGMAGAKDLADHEALGRDDTPANLFIIVDEFAALVKEVPEFVAGVVDLAQRGRSLGMHLVLATQRPAGVISDSILANTNLRIALRVAEDDESTDVVGVATAAHIDRNTPGRGVYRVGPKEIRPFQAGYVGGRTSLERPPIEVGVRPFVLGGGGPVALNAVPQAPGEGPTDLQRIVDVTSVAAGDLRLGDPHRPWLDPLAPFLDLRTLVGSRPVPAGCILIGELDDPEHQQRRPAKLDLARGGSVLVVGAGRSGKTAFLRTVAAAIALQDGEPMDVYGLDFVGRGLAMLGDLAHVGEIVAGDDGERLLRLMTRLQATIARRADLFAAMGVSDLADYHRRTGASDERRTVVLLDGVQAFEAAYEQVDRGALVDALPRLISEGRAAGVHFVITADRRASVRSAVFGLVNTVVVLRQSSSDELANLNLHPDAIAPQAPPGRCYIGGLEGQIALLGSPEGEGQATAMAELAASLTAGWQTPSVPLVPVVVRRENLRSGRCSAPGQVLIGLDGDALEPVSVELLSDHFCVLGRRRSGRTTALGILATGLGSARCEAGSARATLVLVTARPSPLRSVASWDRVVEGEHDARDLLEELAGLDPVGAGAAIVVFIDDLADLGDCFDGELADVLAKGVDRLRVVVAAETRKAMTSFSGSVLGELRGAQRGLVLQPSLPEQEDLFEVRLSASSTLRFPPGRGFLVERDQSTLVQVVAG